MFDEPFIEQQRRKWKPAIHCSNCEHCIVVVRDDKEHGRCKKDHGDDIPLGKLIRQPYGRGFRNAASCPDFSSMD